MSNSRKWIERRLAVGNVRYLVSGDCAVTVEFGNEISPEINRKIRAFKIALEKEQIEGIVETRTDLSFPSCCIQAGSDPVLSTDRKI